MKPVIVLVALSCVGYYAFYGQAQFAGARQSQKVAEMAVSTAQADVKKKDDEVAAQKKKYSTEISKLQSQILGVQGELAQAKEALLHPPVVAVAPPPSTPVTVTKVETTPGPSAEQMAARRDELARSYYFMVLKDGTVLKNVTIERISDGEMALSTPTGKMVIPHSNLPPDTVRKFGLDLADSGASPPAAPTPTSVASSMPPPVPNPIRPPQSRVINAPANASPFGLSSDQMEASTTTVKQSLSDAGSMVNQAQINELRAKAEQFRRQASQASDSAEAQRLLNLAKECDDEISFLQAPEK